MADQPNRDLLVVCVELPGVREEDDDKLHEYLANHLDFMTILPR